MPIDKKVRTFITHYQDDEPTDAQPGDVWFRPSKKFFYVRTPEHTWRESAVPSSLWSQGYVCGGGVDLNDHLSTIDRFQFPFDSGTASHVGNLVDYIGGCAACNSLKSAYIFAGRSSTIDSDVSYIQRIDFPFDSGTAIIDNYLPYVAQGHAANNSSTHGYCCGGNDGVGVQYSYVSRLSFYIDAAVAVTGYISIARSGPVSANNSSQYGYVCGGWGGDFLSTIDRFQFPFDSGTASHVGDLSLVRSSSSGNNSSQHGYVCGGYDGPNFFSTIDRFQFPFDSGTATHVGDLSEARRGSSANNSSQHGYVCSGYDGTSHFSTIDRFQFPFDSGTASHVGNLSQSKEWLAGADGTDFVQIFA